MPITSLVLSATIFFEGSLRDHASAIIEAWDLFRAWCPPESMRWFSTEVMPKHRMVNRSTVGALAERLAPEGRTRPVMSFELKDGDTFDATPRWLFQVVGVEDRLGEPSLVQIAVPWDDTPSTAQRLRTFTTRLVERLDASHAVAGSAILVSPYAEELAQTHAWSCSMRHPCVDILLGENDRITVGRNSLKGINWLTFVDGKRLRSLGGGKHVRTLVDPAVTVTPVGSGLLFEAGATPQIGDETQPEPLALYRNVFRALEPLTPSGIERSRELVLSDWQDAQHNSTRWRRRLAEP